MGGVAAAIGLAGGLDTRLAIGLWVVLAARAVLQTIAGLVVVAVSAIGVLVGA